MVIFFLLIPSPVVLYDTLLVRVKKVFLRNTFVREFLPCCALHGGGCFVFLQTKASYPAVGYIEEQTSKASLLKFHYCDLFYSL